MIVVFVVFIFVLVVVLYVVVVDCFLVVDVVVFGFFFVVAISDVNDVLKLVASNFSMQYHPWIKR